MKNDMKHTKNRQNKHGNFTFNKSNNHHTYFECLSSVYYLENRERGIHPCDIFRECNYSILDWALTRWVSSFFAGANLLGNDFITI